MDYDFKNIRFDTRSVAEEVLDKLIDIWQKYGSASVADFYDLVGKLSTCEDAGYGWVDLGNTVITRSLKGGYFIDFPEPVVMDISKTCTNGHLHLGSHDAFDGTRYFDLKVSNKKIPYNYGYMFRKELNSMPKVDDVLQAKINEIQDIYNLKMSQLEVEREQEIEKLRKENAHERYVEQAKEGAFRQKAKLDALIEAGFTKKEAMEMLMQDISSY